MNSNIGLPFHRLTRSGKGSKTFLQRCWQNSLCSEGYPFNLHSVKKNPLKIGLKTCSWGGLFVKVRPLGGTLLWTKCMVQSKFFNNKNLNCNIRKICILHFNISGVHQVQRNQAVSTSSPQEKSAWLNKYKTTNTILAKTLYFLLLLAVEALICQYSTRTRVKIITHKIPKCVKF